KGVRVQAIIQELGGVEKVDIIQWAEDTKTYIAQALSPAKNVTVEVDEENKIAHVKVPTDELSLAIGKEGQNVRLAHKLTGYRIEIEGSGESLKEPEQEVKEQKETKAKDEKTKEEETADPKDEVIEDAASENPGVEPAPVKEMEVPEEKSEEPNSKSETNSN